MMRREMRARRRLGANSRSTDVVVTPWADEYVPAPCADLPTYPPCHAGAGGRTYLPTPPLISEVGLPTMKKHKTQRERAARPPVLFSIPCTVSCRAAPFLTAGFVFYPPPLRSSCHRRTTNTSGILQSSRKHL